MYGHCLDDPVNRIDPTGMEWKGLGEIGSAIASCRATRRHSHVLDLSPEWW
ncbi:MAG: hypothetical protein AB7E47_06820 [Desulfovibrionaceae bacterium]